MALGRVPLESVDPGEAVAAQLTRELLHLLQERQKLTAANLLGNMILLTIRSAKLGRCELNAQRESEWRIGRMARFVR